MEGTVYRDLNDNIVEVNLPAAVFEVESHFSWMLELIPYIDPGNRNGPYSLEGHVGMRLRREEESPHDCDINLEEMSPKEVAVKKYNSDNPEYCLFYAELLNKAVKFAIIGKFDKALVTLKELDIEEINAALNADQREALNYAVDALKWSIRTIKNQRDEEEQEDVEGPDTLRLRWADIENNKKCLAVIEYLKGKFGSSLNITETRLVEIYRKTVELEPDHHVWYTVVYRTLRGLRRNFERQQSGKLLPPGVEERSTCETAFKLDPDIYCTIKNKAVMLKDSLYTSEVRDVEEARECMRLMKKSLEIATSRDNPTWKRRVLIYFSDLLLDDRGPLSDDRRGKKLLDQCLREYPKSSHVLHKAARFHQYNRSIGDYKLAGNFYERALNIDPKNYPCVKDYLKFLANGRKYWEYVVKCNQFMGAMTKDYTISGLHILKGCVLWIFKPEEGGDPQENEKEACNSWLNVIRLFPACVPTLVENIRSPPFRIGRNPARIDVQRVIATLEGLRGMCTTEQNDKIEWIAKFIDSLREN